jgi:hypothetical protein
MTTTEISPSESSRPLAHSINSVCREANCGRTKVYEAINDGDLVARKLASRTVVLDEDLQAWLRALPRIANRSTPDDPGRLRPADGGRPRPRPAKRLMPVPVSFKIDTESAG